MAHKTTLGKQILSGLLIGLLAAPVLAAGSEDTRGSRSISFNLESAPDASGRETQLKQAEMDKMTALVKQGFRAESAVTGIHVESSSYNPSGDFTIYNASTDLISDFDDDGFYHRFSVNIDADTVFATSYVYARLYLSYEGGPWNHYATSDAYHIHGDSELDSFTIETELADGFSAGYYDVRIELYDADTNQWLLNYGPYDDSSLSALPLEDSYYDSDIETNYYPIETEVVVTANGAFGWWLLFAPVLLIAARRLAKNKSCLDQI